MRKLVEFSSFRGDIPAMLAARDKVCAEFHKNKHVKSETSIKELVMQGNKTLIRL